MSAPVIKVFAPGEKPTNEDINTVLSTLANKFGNLDGTDFFWPLTLPGDLNLGGNRLLRAREIFGILNMTEFGADETAFETAITDLSGGGIIFIPRDTTITVSRAIKVRGNRSRIYIIGSGHTSRIKLDDDADDDVLTFDGASRFRVSNLFIDGNRGNNSVGHGIRLKNCTDFEISGCWIGGQVSAPADAGCAQASILMDGCDRFVVSGNWIRDGVGPGIVVSSCRDGVIKANSIRDMSSPDGVGRVGYGIYLEDSESIRVTANSVSDCAWDGCSAVNCQNVRISYNTFRRVNAGVFFQGESADESSYGCVAHGNTVAESEKGIVGGSYTYGVISSNQVRSNTTPLIMSDSASLDLVNNQCMDVANHGVVTMGSGNTFIDLDIGVSNLPIRAIHATWKYGSTVADLTRCVLGAVYQANGPGIVTFYAGTNTLTDKDIWYSIYV